ncbi:Sterol 3-beta-glucosyltransferase [Phytophthora fragariae]|uniref:Sterol 3-beta-glucosyltransferase n=4 Tax=Phytophthora fragariae TaxID=53985 RepID=A0A6A3EYL1_9STRA|nr:Sterol 3-beta-glucosyltransferase [Phytophthora fragariae]KAE8938614.1 Sterol 3-beta-glucosyltransferase [Phytophthora fragariae]KAE9114163.1 Sterol 3-beta-glucosyltransferase [Phytophthora fragariae]KAE9145371.1 Sterol 3-beta-glucosyltransferase [Phytophthora fragariae]KAE9235108.1 Sterol 3-beta-glucosyltransferase [Phytophthora fragariae]
MLELRGAKVETTDNIPDRTRSFASGKFDKISAVLALQRPDGHIQLDFPAEDAIDLQTPRLDAPESTNQPPTREHDIDSKKQLTAKLDSDLVSVPPLMSICILIVGTRGDVQPFLAIAQRLQRDGHRVRLATHAVYRDFVMSHDVEFYPLGGDPKELAAYMVKTGGHLIPTKIETLTKDVPRNRTMINEIVLSTWPAVSEADPDGGGPGVPGPPFRAQAIIANPVSYGHIHVAERLGVPLHIMFPQPWVPTMAFPHPLSNLAYTGNPLKRNYLSYKLVDLIMWHGTEGMINEFRTEVLKLRPIRNGDLGSELLLDLEIPHAFMWSPKLVPKPADWGDLYDVIGTVSLKEAASVYSPSPELEAFLGDDGGPIFVGFGSMVLADPLATTKMIVDAATQANVRVLIQSSWSDMAGDLEIPSNVFFIGNCPHDWLMPRVSAVVHHGGAGTTAAGLLAGKPTFIVPFFGDQPFWGQAVVSAGVGVAPCSIAQLTTEVLCKAFVGLQSSELRTRAEALRDVMQQEDGAEDAVRSFYRHLPAQDMWCDLDHQRIAIQWSVHDKIKLCDRCAFVIKERPGNEHKKLLRYNAVDYSARGPSSLLTGVATGLIVFAHELTGGMTGFLSQPAKGLMKGGIVGAVKGVVSGAYYLLVRPVHGALLLADHAATGQKNANREEGHRKLNSVFDSHLMAALGAEDGLAGTVCPAIRPNAVDIVIFVRRGDRKKMLKRLRRYEKYRYRGRYEAILKAQKAKAAGTHIDGDASTVCGDFLSPSYPPKVLPLRHSYSSDDMMLLEADAGSNISSTSTSVESMAADADTEPQITLRTAQLTPNGAVEVTLGVPGESADVVGPSTMNEWEAYSNHQHKMTGQTAPSVPVMNICLAPIGTWNNGVKQFVAIGIKLKGQGHRVRVAANERFRTEIMARGLEFYPLAGAPESIQDFAKFVYDSQTAARAAMPGRLGTGAIQAFKELMYSLWPAAYGSDPHGGGTNIPGKHFRADALLWHPLLLGHVHVAERLGIPLQCASLEPLSPTYSFPHPLSSITGFDTPMMKLCRSNLLTYGIVDTAIWHGSVAEVLTQFRAFIGLQKRCDLPDPLVRWEVPHIYLWNPALLPKPLDWGAELSAVGHVTLGINAGLSRRNRKKREKENKRFKWPSALTEFAFQTSTPPVIYFGVSTRTMSPGILDELLQKVDAAASDQRVRIVFQTREVGDKQRALNQSANVLEIASNLPYARLFQEPIVAGVIHWGEPDIIAESLSVGKPIGVCGTHPCQQFMASVCERAQVGLPLIDCRTCTVESLASSFGALLTPDLRQRAQTLAASFNPTQALDAAVAAFHANLPLEAMRCDVDASQLARVFDSRHDLKLSLQAYASIQPRYDESKGFVPYRPLRFGGGHPPTFSIRGNAAEVTCDVKPTREPRDGVQLALGALGGDGGSSSSSSPTGSRATIAMFWSSAGEEAAVRKATSVAYDRIVKKTQRESKRQAVMRCFGVGSDARHRQEELACISVE